MKASLTRLIRNLQSEIRPESRASIVLTVGLSPNGAWDYQTGDNSYWGPALFHPLWAIVTVHRSSNCADLADDVLSKLGIF